MTKRQKPKIPKPKKARASRRNNRRYETLDESDLLESDLSVLDWIVRHVGSMGYPPTFREIQKVFKIPSTDSVNNVLNRLELYGFLDVDYKIVRGIRLISLPNVDDVGVARLKLWLVEASQIITRLNEDDDKIADAWVKKVSILTF